MPVIMTDYIERPLYIDRLKPFIGKSMIKVLVGQRRVGKSYLLMQIRDIIKKQSPETQIIYINKEQHEFSSIANSDDLFQYLKYYNFVLVSFLYLTLVLF